MHDFSFLPRNAQTKQWQSFDQLPATSRAEQRWRAQFGPSAMAYLDAVNERLDVAMDL
jgi:hypothetical protein